MITRVCCRLIKEVDRFAIQCRELTLEPNIPDLGHVFFSITPIVLEEKGDRSSRVPVSTVQIQFEDIGSRNWLRDFQFLRRGEFRGGCEVEVVAVFEEFYGLGGRWSRCSVDKE